MEYSVHGNDVDTTELNDVIISVVKVTLVQTCGSFFDVQRDANTSNNYIAMKK